MQKVHVSAENGAYDIEIGNNILSEHYIEEYDNYAVITDSNVHSLYHNVFDERRTVIIKPGEESKNMQVLEYVYDKLMQMGIDRKSAVVAFGGGVVGDLVGFAAATFKRGIEFIQIPTTLLSQVDSSVGGKVAVNLKSGKNMVGAFYQPKKVIADIGTLKTLPTRECSAGMAEVIKYAYIYDEALHRTLSEKENDMESIVAQCCRIKAVYVKEDPYDRGVRMQLNYGHTIGHAIETAAGYGTYLHGEAVAIGMVYAAALGEALGISPKGLVEDTISLLKKNSLPYSIDQSLLEHALDLLGADKKAEGNFIPFVLIDQIGHAVLERLSTATIKETVLKVKI